MKKTYKIITALASALSLCAGTFLLSSCGDSVSAVVVGRNDTPRLTYVQGQDLDLSTGKLTVQYESGKSESVELNSPDVVVSGYDKNALGRQTVTLTYKENETTLDVMVIARLSAESVQTVYYVGEQNFDTAKGKIRIANDDGTTFTLSLSDKSLSFSGFDSSKAAESLPITVRYQKDGADYTGTFNVRIYGTDNAKFTPPLKTSYRSHEKLTLNGAQITYTNGDPKFDKMITVTDDMASGADFSLVKEENDQSNPLKQTVTVTYGGNTFRFEISIVYSNVTRLNKLLDTVKYEGGKPVQNEENGALMATCAQLYLNELTPSEKTYIDKDGMTPVIAGAAEYAYGKWSEDLEKYSHTFAIEDGNIVYSLESYETCKADATALQNSEAPINAYLKLLQIIAEQDGLTIGETPIAEYLAPVSVYAEERDGLITILTEATSLYDMLVNVPEQWTTLSSFQSQIDKVRDTITARGKEAYRNVYRRVSAWRTQNDFFDIVYAYYSQAEDPDSIEKMKGVILPAALEEVYSNLLSAITQYTYIYNGVQTEGGTSHVTDSTLLFYYFRTAEQAANEIKAGAEGLNKSLYETLTFDGILYNSTTHASIAVTFDELFQFVKTTRYGYYDIMGSTIDDPVLTALWEKYLGLFGDLTDEAFASEMSEIMQEFASLSAPRQRVFLLTMNVYYGDYDSLALDTEISYTYFIRLINSFYSEEFNDTEFNLLRNLLMAIENYTRAFDDEDGMKNFLSGMAEVKRTHDSARDIAKFDAIFYDTYVKYTEIAEKYNADGTLKAPVALDEHWQGVFDTLKNEIAGVIQAYNALAEEDETKREQSYIRILASYERSKRLVADILASDTPDSVKEAYARNLYSFGESLDWTLDYAYTCHAATLGTFAYTALSVSGEPFWEIVCEESDVRDFFAAITPIVWQSRENGDLEFTEEGKENFISVMKSYLQLQPRFKGIFTQLQGLDENHDYYYDGLKIFFAAIFQSEDAESTKRLCEAAEALMQAERDYGVYGLLLYQEEHATGEPEEPTEPTEPADPDEEEISTSEEALEAFRNSMTAYETAYNALTEEERTAFSLLQEIVDYYTQVNADLA